MGNAHIKVSGAWKTVNKLHVKVAGTWKRVYNGYIKVAGVWKRFYGGVVTVSGQTIDDPNGVFNTFLAKAAVRFNSDGTVDELIDNQGAGVYTQIDAITDWVIPNAANGGYHIRATELSQAGTGLRSGTLGVWTSLASDQEWFVTNASMTTGIVDWSLTIEISDDGGTTTLDSATYNLQTEVV